MAEVSDVNRDGLADLVVLIPYENKSLAAKSGGDDEGD